MALIQKPQGGKVDGMLMGSGYFKHYQLRPLIFRPAGDKARPVSTRWQREQKQKLSIVRTYTSQVTFK